MRDLGFERRAAAPERRGREGRVGEELGEVVMGFGEVECAVAAVRGIVEAARLSAGQIGVVEEVEVGVWIRE